MKLFYWNLSTKEKFFRSLWTGLLALLVLYIAVWFLVDDATLKIALPITLTIIYAVTLFIKYLKLKKE